MDILYIWYIRTYNSGIDWPSDWSINWLTDWPTERHHCHGTLYPTHPPRDQMCTIKDQEGSGYPHQKPHDGITTKHPPLVYTPYFVSFSKKTTTL